MMPKTQKQSAGRRGGIRRAWTEASLWLRRVMPHVALVTGALFVVWLSFGDSTFFRETFIGPLFRYITFCAVFLTCVYYGLRALRWVKRKLLWRVRRRLVITYLFVGLTPIILMALLSFLSAFGGSGQGMARIITAQVNATERQTRAGAKGLAESLMRLPPGVDDRAVQSWLDERGALLRASLPGARVAVWRGAPNEEAGAVGHKGSAQFISQVDEESTRGVGDDSASVGYRLPDWLRNHAEWGGLSFTQSAKMDENFGSPSMRALVRGVAGNRPFALLVAVPVSRALIQQYRETTGIYVRPFFVYGAMNGEGSRVNLRLRDATSYGPNVVQTDEEASRNLERGVEDMFRHDQFGEETGRTFYVVVLPATNWASGESGQHLSFLFDWSWALVSKQFWGGSQPGELWRRALIYIAIIFLILEVLALVASAWMTRAVTGTVHKLYSAVEFIKQGDFSHRVRTRSHDQLGELASAFNDMSANIEALLQERVERERLEREVEIAAQVQAQLFPRRVPELLTAEISAECRAARGVAGDYYDYIEIAPGLIAIALGDVSGKGVSASLVMSNLQASLRAQTTITAERMETAERALAASAEAEGAGSGQVLTQAVAAAEIDGAVARKMTNINRQICQSTEDNRFATLFLALYEDRTRRLHYTNAGHNAPILVRADGTIERLTTGGMMVGAFEWAEYEEAAVTLGPGDVLLVVSDGISEAANEEGEEYGEERLTQFAVGRRELAAQELRDAVFAEVDAWTNGRERDDDQTLVIVKVLK
ncbi:MAG TPA: SpoIIE family protein phosphatase [Pyrinomonadaceae bacterium]|nr:SpoIIE family protein phosphatase [Pyrinomonadaceae bacterium]